MIYDVVIVGAGVIGAMAARELSRYHLSICLLEKENDVATGASAANSGIIHGGHDPIPGTLKARMNALGTPLLYQAARELNVPCRNNGSFVCAFGTPEEEAMIRELLERGHRNGIEGLSVLSGDEARALEPELSKEVSMVLNIPSSGIICPYELTIAAAGNAMDNGVELLRNFRVSAISKKENFCLSSDDGRRVEGRYLVNCAGGFSGQIAEMVGDGPLTILPRAGAYLLLDKAEGTRVSRTIFQVPTASGKGILVTPTVDGNLLTGPTAVPVASAENTEVTQAEMDQVMNLAAKSVPGINFRQVITSFSGVRASVKTGDFIIRPADAVEHMIHAAAIDSPGLTACVAIAKRIVRLLEESGLQLVENPDWNGCRENPRAFREMTEEEQDRYIRLHPDYGRIVCRCETISEGEIRDAIRRNPGARDLDGIKRRTRSGMGRCQGGFCSPGVMKLLSEELGIPMEQVSKCGRGSELLTGRL